MMSLNYYFIQTRQWVDLFLSLGSHYEGFQRKDITPYMHIFAYHVPVMIAQLGSIKHFSGQGMHRLHTILNHCYMLFVYTHAGVEKNNDDAKRNYFSSNRHDAAKEILATEARLETLRNGTQDRESCVRQKRKYKKSDSVYWNESIRTQRQPTQSPPS